MLENKTIVISGMSLLTPLSDNLTDNLNALLAGKSALSHWHSLDTSRCYSKIGADLGRYNVPARAKALALQLPAPIAERMMKMLRRVPWSIQLSLLMVADTLINARLSVEEAAQTHVIVGGHNLSSGYTADGLMRFFHHPNNVEVSQELYSLDTTQAACISELLGSHKAAYTVGGACASGNIALQAGMREIRLRGARRVMVVGAVAEPSPISLHAFALLGALSIESFNDRPAQASRPWDQKREGFVPAHGGGVMLLECAEDTIARGVKPHAELCSVAVCSDASHLTVPDEDGQSRAISLALKRGNVPASAVDYISAHATSTPLGDLVELRAIRRALGAHAERIKINASKSMLGHSFSAAAIVEGIIGILQMNAGRLHGTLNLENIDPSVDLDVCPQQSQAWPINYFINNAFGFGGINAVSLFHRVSA